MNIYDGLQDSEKRREPKTTKCIFGTMRKRPLRVLRPCYTSKPFPVLSASSHHRCRLGRARTSCPNRTHSQPAVLDVVQHSIVKSPPLHFAQKSSTSTARIRHVLQAEQSQPEILWQTTTTCPKTQVDGLASGARAWLVQITIVFWKADHVSEKIVKESQIWYGAARYH